jgi:hypothetical protein
VKQLGSVDIHDLNNGVIRISDVRRRLAPDFLGTFNSLLDMMGIQETKERLKLAKQESQGSTLPPSSSTMNTTLKRAAESQEPPNPSKRLKEESNTSSAQVEPTTPDNPTRPSDSNLTGESTLSTTSKSEEHTRKLIIDVLRDTMSVLEEEFQAIRWQGSGHEVELCRTLPSVWFSADM